MKENDRKEFSQITWQLMRFGLVNLSGAGIALGILNIFMFLWSNFAVANIVIFVIVVTWNFILHRRFTFSTNGPFIHQWFKYFFVSLGASALSWIISIGLYYSFSFFNKHFNYAALMGVGFTCIANFFYTRSYVFQR